MDWSEAVLKKYACYLSACLLAAPLVVMAEQLPVVEGPVQQALAQLAVTCPDLARRLNEPQLRQLQAFYQSRNDRLLWSESQHRAALQSQLQALADDGLEPSDYALPVGHDVCAELGTSQQYLKALQDLHFGRLSQERFEPMWYAQPVARDKPHEALGFALAGGEDITRAFELARPNFSAYRQLRDYYAHQRKLPLPQWKSLADGPLLRPQMQDARVPELAQRLFNEGYLKTLPARSDTRYSAELVSAVKQFQSDHSLQADGVIGAGTISALNVSPAMRRAQLRINLERMRWLALDFEPTSLLVNVPAAQLTVYKAGVPVWQTRTQVGRAARQTPLLKSQVTRLTLNPTWTIPPTILREDKLPQIRRDPSYLNRQNLQVLDRNGRPLAPESVNWDNPGNIVLRQSAGPRNPLGQLAIRFPNPFSVYLHDTPSQALFSKGPRAFSSGCVRVEHALQLPDWLLSPAERERAEQQLSTGLTHEFRLSTPVPIVLGYWTAEVDSQGRLIYAPDIYGFDSKLLAAMEARRPVE